MVEINQTILKADMLRFPMCELGKHPKRDAIFAEHAAEKGISDAEELNAYYKYYMAIDVSSVVAPGFQALPGYASRLFTGGGTEDRGGLFDYNSGEIIILQPDTILVSKAGLKEKTGISDQELDKASTQFPHPLHRDTFAGRLGTGGDSRVVQR